MSETAYYADATHLNAAGDREVREYARPAVLAARIELLEWQLTKMRRRVENACRQRDHQRDQRRLLRKRYDAALAGMEHFKSECERFTAAAAASEPCGAFGQTVYGVNVRCMLGLHHDGPHHWAATLPTDAPEER